MASHVEETVYITDIRKYIYRECSSLENSFHNEAWFTQPLESDREEDLHKLNFAVYLSNDDAQEILKNGETKGIFDNSNYWESGGIVFFKEGKQITYSKEVKNVEKNSFNLEYSVRGRKSTYRKF